MNEIITQLIADQEEKIRVLRQGAQEALKKHYLLSGAAGQAAAHLKELQDAAASEKESPADKEILIPAEEHIDG